MLEHEKIEPKHLVEPQTAYQRTVQRILHRILELSTIELVIATLHLMVTTAAVLGLLGGGGGHAA